MRRALAVLLSLAAAVLSAPSVQAIDEYDEKLRALLLKLLVEQGKPVPSHNYLGNLGGNQFAPNTTANPLSPAGNSLYPNSVLNQLGRYGNPLSPYSATNPYAAQAPKIFARDGTYLGRLSSNRFDAESVSNPFGKYGSKFSPLSINNPYGHYGSQFSPLSPKNPFTTTPPVILSGEE